MSEKQVIVKNPDDYAGEPRCFVCAMSPGRVFFPVCATKLADGTSYTHEETCQKYAAERDPAFPHDWLCLRCAAEEARWLQEHS